MKNCYTPAYLSTQTPVFCKDKAEAFEAAASFLRYEEIWVKNSINILIDLCNNEDTTRQDMVRFMKRAI